MNFIKKHKRLILLFSSLTLLLVLSGCGVDYAKDADGNILKDAETGARVITNMIDTNTGFGDAWNAIKGGDLFNGLLVMPLSILITFFGEILGYGLSIIISTVIVRYAVYPITKKSTENSQRMQELQPKINRINAKYRGKEQDKEAQARKQQETMALYQKEGINPLKGCVSPLVTLPIFLAFFSSIYRTSGIYTDKFLGMTLANNPIVAFQNGEYAVIALVIFVIAANFFSMKLTTGGQDNPQTKNLPLIMTAMIGIFIFQIPAGVALYWGTGSLVMMTQQYFTKRKRSDR
jgi:YidC/Oxa1 family membrane protein insertase